MVDWAETEKAAKEKNIKDADTRIKTFVEGYYVEGSTAKEHLVVMQSYKQVGDVAVACGRH